MIIYIYIYILYVYIHIIEAWKRHCLPVQVPTKTVPEVHQWSPLQGGLVTLGDLESQSSPYETTSMNTPLVKLDDLVIMKRIMKRMSWHIATYWYILSILSPSKRLPKQASKIADHRLIKKSWGPWACQKTVHLWMTQISVYIIIHIYI